MKKLLFSLLAFSLVLISCKKGSGADGPDTPDEPAAEVQKDIPAIESAVSAFMLKYSIPGLSLAITKGERLVYLKAYGQVGVTDNTPVTTASLFRVASVSKPITSVGVMKLIEAGKLTLDSKVFGTGSILGNDYPSSRLSLFSDITVGQLLHHSTGAWPNDGTDPMFLQPGYSQAQLIRWVLDTYPAGTRGTYKYSNFGFCLLGRIIEKVSGKPYDQFIKDEVLTPSGVTGMRIGGNTLAERLPGEVIYSGQGGENPYAYQVTRMDAHGGWVASAKDLAMMMVHVDGFSAKADILKTATLGAMTTVGVTGSNYACGWAVNSANNWWHTGSLPGTASEIIRSASGYNWVVLVNTRALSAGFDTDLDNLIWPVVNNQATPWQSFDQFQ